MNKLPTTIVIGPDGDGIPSGEVLRDERHFLRSTVDVGNRDIYFEFSSRQALQDFAMSLLHEAIYGHGGQKEFYPLIVDGKALVVDGARLVADSSRIFVSYAEK